MTNSFGRADLLAANARLKMLAFYPSDPEAQAAVMELLAKICPDREALEWLVDTMINKVGTWKGPTELRGVLCWRYPPADGVEADSSIRGFTPADGESLSIERHNELRQLEKAAPLREMLKEYRVPAISRSESKE